MSGRSPAIENFGCTRLVNAGEWGAPWSLGPKALHPKPHRLGGDTAPMRTPRAGRGGLGQ